MRRFGDTSSFGVDFELANDHHGVWMFGHCRYWCGGREIGDFSNLTSLRDCLFSLEGIRRGEGHRSNPRLWAMSPIDVFRLIDAALFGSNDIVPSALALGEQWAHHNIKPEIDTFDRSKIYLVERGSIARIIYSVAPYVDITSLEIKAGEVDIVLGSARSELLEIYNQEVKKTGAE